MASYRGKYGVVGKYRGCDVKIVKKNEMKAEMKNNNGTIFAVEDEGKNYVLVVNGTIIGAMEENGTVHIGATTTPYNYEEPKKKEVPRASEPTVSVATEGYAAYSKVVDDFFKGLGELWQEIGV